MYQTYYNFETESIEKTKVESIPTIENTVEDNQEVFVHSENNLTFNFDCAA